MGINCYQLDKDKDYTLCIEILIQITNYGINQLLQLIKPHQKGYQLLVLRYKSFLTGTQIVVIVNFQKTVWIFMLIYPNGALISTTTQKIGQKNWMIAYGVFGKVSSIDPQKT